MSAKKITIYPSGESIKELSGRFEKLEEHNDIPILILPKVVLFPGQTLPISSLEGLKGVDFQLAQKGMLRIGVLSEMETREAHNSSQLAEHHLSLVGTEAIITGLVKMSDGSFGAVLKGVRRLIVHTLTKRKFGFTGHVTIIAEKSFRSTSSFLASVKALKNLVNKVIKLNPAISQETVALIYTTEDPVFICDLITPHLSIATKEKLELLGSYDFRARLKQTLKYLSREVDLLELSFRIQDDVRNDMQDNMKKAFLREQIVAIKREIGDLDGEKDEWEDLQKKFNELDLSKAARGLVDRELERLEMMHPGVPEYMVSWNYLNWVKDLPWGQKGTKKEEAAIPELEDAGRVLNKSHYGLQKVKERILEYIAILQRKGNLNGQVILLLGPPGVGKTSLVKSIAKSLNRNFVQISLGGVKDEAEIRGHRRTYIGAMPGKIIQAIKTAESSNPVVLLDEVDKVGSGNLMQSDLSSSLLELLDPEQNKEFTDHYLGFPFDLSKVFFITTANSLEGISKPLLDRMEVIELSSYTETEKVQIAKLHILPKIRKDLKLSANEFSIEEQTSRQIIRKYTREAGVRQLSREYGAIGRKVVRRLMSKKRVLPINTETLQDYLGQPRFIDEPSHNFLPHGVAIGLAYTSFGGDILYIESRRSMSLEGKSGVLTVTGSLGKVMKESVQTVFSYILSQCIQLGLSMEQVEKSHLHIHFPDGATPKDGPSAGVAILCALVSLFSEKTVPADFAMTGEITLRGKVLPVGGIKEKLLAAHRYGKKRIILPKENWIDLEDLPQDVLNELTLYPIDNMMEALLITGVISEAEGITCPKPFTYSRRNFG